MPRYQVKITVKVVNNDDDPTTLIEQARRAVARGLGKAEVIEVAAKKSSPKEHN